MNLPVWTSGEIAAVTGGSARGQFSAFGVAIDSREIEPGDLFIALKGEATDGHRFVSQALGRGAAAALVSEPIDAPHVLVEDTNYALMLLGVAARRRLRPYSKIIGVTGSAGKTGTKEALYAALDRYARGQVHRSVKSYNNHTGVPLSLSRMRRGAYFGVFEMGMNHAGELSMLTRLVRPHVAIVTTIASAHREFFATEEAIADAKGEIFEGLEFGGTALVPFDSPHRDRLIRHAESNAAKIVTFGFGEGADIRATYAIRAASGGTLVTATMGDIHLSYTVSQPGDHWVSNSLAVMGAVHAVGGDLAAAGLALAELPGIKGRGERHRIPIEGGEALLIDESYNANPASMAATLRTFGLEKVEGSRIAVLGAMRELGPGSDDFHAGLAPHIEAAKVDYAILVGEEMAPLAKALGSSCEMAHVADAAAAAGLVQDAIGPGDAILVKGSNSVGLAALVDALAAEPDR